MSARFDSHRVSCGSLRRGITILEVLIAAGVLAIGMFGVMALIPLISLRLREGDIADRSAVSGRNAVQEFQLRGWTDPNGWRWYREFDGVYVNPLSPPAIPSGQTAAVNLPYSPAVCVDPLGLVGIVPTTDNRERVFFPRTNLDPAYAMQRVTTVEVANPTDPNAGTNDLLNRSMAEAAVVYEDDMLIERPAARTDLPKQTYTAALPDITVANPDQYQTRRMFSRDYSSIATLVPLDNTAAFTGRGNYLLSCAIFYQRGRDYGDASEHIGSIAATDFFSQGVTGGEVEIDCTADASMIDIAKGDWVMLTFPRLPLSGPPYTLGQAYHRWYLVIETAPFAPGDTSRAVTLSGPDWPYVSTAGVTVPTQVTWLPGVVTVYEKTVSLNSMGEWGG